MKKFNVGDKVLPVSKSVWGKLEESTMWRRAKENNQDFLYVTGYDSDLDSVVCNNENLSYSNGDFFKESDLVLYTEEVVVTNEVKVLVSKLESLIDEVSVVAKELKAFQTQIQTQTQSESNEEQAPNARQQIANEAKAFVEKYRAIKKGDESHTIGNTTARCHYYETEFAKKDNKITALVYHLNLGKERQSNKPNHTGKAICQEGDTFNQYIGEAIALGRALDINVDKFINAVQPTEFAVGQVIHVHLSFDYNQTEVITSIKDSKVYVDKGGFHWATRVEQDNFKILDDTNTTYEVK